MGWLIVFCIIVLLALMPLGLRVSYDGGGPWAAFMIGPVRIQLYPRPKKQKASTPPKKQKTDKASAKKKSGGSIGDFLPLMRLVLDFLKDFRTKLTIDHLSLVLILGGGDPCDLALNYGKGWAVLGNLMPLLEQCFIIKKRDLEVECDFTAEKTTVIAGADLTLRLWQLITLAVTHGPRVIKQYFSIMNKRKGGVNT